MASRKAVAALFIIFLSLVILFLPWSIFCIVGKATLIFSKSITYFIFLIGCLSFAIMLWTLRILMVDIRYEINAAKEKEKNVKACYQYNQLLNPPDTDMNN